VCSSDLLKCQKKMMFLRRLDFQQFRLLFALRHLFRLLLL
jgi:hypothetical protein